MALFGARVKPDHNHPAGTKVESTLVFSEGVLRIKRQGFGEEDGDGAIVLREDQVDWEQGEGIMHIVSAVARSELLAIRDHLIELFPPGEIDQEQEPNGDGYEDRVQAKAHR